MPSYNHDEAGPGLLTDAILRDFVPLDLTTIHPVPVTHDLGGLNKLSLDLLYQVLDELSLLSLLRSRITSRSSRHLVDTMRLRSSAVYSLYKSTPWSACQLSSANYGNGSAIDAVKQRNTYGSQQSIAYVSHARTGNQRRLKRKRFLKDTILPRRIYIRYPSSTTYRLLRR
jgi:hypothetical protein